MAARCVNSARRLAEPPLREVPSFPEAERQLFPSQILLPFTASQEVARRRKAVGRIVCLSRFLTPSSMLEVRGLRCRRPLRSPRPFLVPQSSQ